MTRNYRIDAVGQEVQALINRSGSGGIQSVAAAWSETRRNNDWSNLLVSCGVAVCAAVLDSDMSDISGFGDEIQELVNRLMGPAIYWRREFIDVWTIEKRQTKWSDPLILTVAAFAFAAVDR